MNPLLWQSSLRSKLIVACILLMLLLSGVLFLGNRQILQQTLVRQSSYQTTQVSALLEQSIAIPLAQRDYAVLQQTLERLVSERSIRYIVLFDHRGREVASAGRIKNTLLPPESGKDVDLQAKDATRHLACDVSIGGQLLGSLRFGVSISGLRDAQSAFERQSLAIAVITLLLSIGIITALATVLTRHLAKLERSSQRIADGDFDVLVPILTRDEIGRLGESFNRMAITLRDRVFALNASEMLQRQHLQTSLAEQARLNTLINAIPLGILVVNDDGEIIYTNGAFISIWNLTDNPVGLSVIELLLLLRDRTMASDVPSLEYLRRPPLPEESITDLEIKTIDGHLIAQRVRSVVQPNGGNGYLCLHEDITAARSTQQRAQQALIDPLTGLPNRRGLFENLAAGTNLADEQETELVLMFIDLDDFKHANDVGGHRMGDDILITIGASLLAQMREGDSVARLGGDEFAVICVGISIEEAGIIAARLINEISRLRFATEHEVLRVGCSIGLAIYPYDGRTSDELIACADTAMYQVKQKGKNGWLRYFPDPFRMETDSLRVDWNSRIHSALIEKRLILHYQPIFDAKNRQIAHHEVLLRMVDEHDCERLIFPSDFIFHAERSGKIREIDRWVFEECIKQLAHLPSLTLAANLSAKSLEDNSFAGFLRNTMQMYDVDPRRLHIELTETSAISDPSVAQALIGRLRELGCAVHLDDFGSGFSSFAHLKLLDVDTIKIDGIFIRDLHTDRHNQLFVGSIIEIARNLNKTTIAEQVENQSTFDLLCEMGIDYVQGFYMARPAHSPGATRTNTLSLIKNKTDEGQQVKFSN